MVQEEIMKITIKKMVLLFVCIGVCQWFYVSFLNPAYHACTRGINHGCSQEKANNEGNDSGQSNADVPPTFGHTHFIVGMSAEDMNQLRKESGESSTCDCSSCPAGGSYRKAYFSPDDGLEKKLIDLIDREQASLKIAVFQFTNGQVARAVKRAQLRGVAIEIVTDPLCLQDKFNKITWLAQEGLKIYVYNPDENKTSLSNKMHHKFVVFGKNVDCKKLVWMGSFNITKSADTANQESVVVLDDQQIICQFNKQFDRLKERSILISDFAKNHFIVQAWQPKPTDYKRQSGRKTAVAHAKRIPGHKDAQVTQLADA